MVYDFGDSAVVAMESSVAPAESQARLPLLLAKVTASGVGEGDQSVFYRQSYATDNRLRTYQLARWSLPPEQLFEQRLRQTLELQRPVLTEEFNLARLRDGDRYPAVLRVDISRFEQNFETPTASAGIVQVRATLIDPNPRGDALLGQKTFISRISAETADAQGGAAAMAEAAKVVAITVAQWVESLGK